MMEIVTPAVLWRDGGDGFTTCVHRRIPQLAAAIAYQTTFPAESTPLGQMAVVTNQRRRMQSAHDPGGASLRTAIKQMKSKRRRTHFVKLDTEEGLNMKLSLPALAAIAVTPFADASIPSGAQHFVDQLGLTKTQYGTYLKETWTSSLNVTDLPERFEGGVRPLSSSIYQVYTVDSDPSAGNEQAGFPLHRLQSDEQWHWYAGDGNINLYLFDVEAGSISTVHLGIDGADAVPQFTVPQLVWIGALLADGTSWCLTVRPTSESRHGTLIDVLPT